MGYHEAIKDGIRIEKNKLTTRYYPKCYKCGEEVMSYNYIPTSKYTCCFCKTIENQRKYLNKNRARI